MFNIAEHLTDASAAHKFSISSSQTYAVHASKKESGFQEIKKKENFWHIN